MRVLKDHQNSHFVGEHCALSGMGVDSISHAVHGAVSVPWLSRKFWQKNWSNDFTAQAVHEGQLH